MAHFVLDYYSMFLGRLQAPAAGSRPADAELCPLSQNLTVLPAPPKGEPIAAQGQLLLSLGYALALPLGELLNEVKLRGRGLRHGPSFVQPLSHLR